MIAKIETAIWLALRQRIESLPLDYFKAWPGEKAEAPYEDGALQPYLRIGRVSTAPVRQLIANGKPHERTGFLMITLVFPMGQDIKIYDQIGGTIAEHFKDGTEMVYEGVCVAVTSYPHVQEGYDENGYWTVPVRVPWRCFA